MLPREKPSSERPRLGSLAFPAIVTNLMFSLVVIAQTKFVGELGEQAIAAVGMGQRVFFGDASVVDGNYCGYDRVSREKLGSGKLCRSGTNDDG